MPNKDEPYLTFTKKDKIVFILLAIAVVAVSVWQWLTLRGG